MSVTPNRKTNLQKLNLYILLLVQSMQRLQGASVMHIKALKHIIKQRFTALEKAVRQIQKDFDKDAIHAFRVQVKKLRTFLLLLDLKLPGKVKKVYAAAGQIREIQLQLKQIRKASEDSPEPAGYLSKLEEELAKRKAFFTRLSEEKHFGSSRRKLIKKLPPKLPSNHITELLHKETATMLVAVDAGLSGDEDLHNTRKKIKNILYINDLYKEELQQHHGPALLNERSHKKALALADELGKFVDKWVALSMLKPGWLTCISPEEKKQLRPIRQRWQSQKNLLRKHVAGELRSTAFRKALKK